MPKPRPQPTLPALLDALENVRLTELPSTKAARLAAELVRECREPEPGLPPREAILAAARAMKPKRGG